MSKTLLLVVSSLLLCCFSAFSGPICDEVTCEVVAEGFSFPEGPVFDRLGNLYVVNYRRIGDIARITPQGEVSVFLDLNPSGEINGMFLDREGMIVGCDDGGGRIVSIDPSSRRIETIVDSYQGQRFNNPNDLALCANGDIYFTDPYHKDKTTGGRVFAYIKSEKKLYLLRDGLAFPNGIAVSADRRTLYVGETTRRWVIAYPLAEGGRALDGDGRIFFRMWGGYGPDGIELDEAGNLYITHAGGGTIYLVSPEGKLLRCFTGIGPNPTNLELRDGWLYVTDEGNKRVVRFPRPSPGELQKSDN